METILFNKDIKVMYVTATSFPEGVLAAHQKLHSLIPFSTDKRYFGISRPEHGGGIVYRASAEELESGEAEKLNLETMVLKKGNYLCVTIRDYKKDIPEIGRTFEQLTSQPNIDLQGYCVEWYISDKDLRCMIRLNN
jgi:predicted transcriptional regulator YdeE